MPPVEEFTRSDARVCVGGAVEAIYPGEEHYRCGHVMGWSQNTCEIDFGFLHRDDPCAPSVVGVPWCSVRGDPSPVDLGSAENRKSLPVRVGDRVTATYPPGGVFEGGPVEGGIVNGVSDAVCVIEFDREADEETGPKIVGVPWAYVRSIELSPAHEEPAQHNNTPVATREAVEERAENNTDSVSSDAVPVEPAGASPSRKQVLALLAGLKPLLAKLCVDAAAEIDPPGYDVNEVREQVLEVATGLLDRLATDALITLLPIFAKHTVFTPHVESPDDGRPADSDSVELESETGDANAQGFAVTVRAGMRVLASNPADEFVECVVLDVAENGCFVRVCDPDDGPDTGSVFGVLWRNITACVEHPPGADDDERDTSEPPQEPGPADETKASETAGPEVIADTVEPEPVSETVAAGTSEIGYALDKLRSVGMKIDGATLAQNDGNGLDEAVERIILDTAVDYLRHFRIDRQADALIAMLAELYPQGGYGKEAA